MNPSTGAQIIATGAVEGDCVGTPVTTKDGKYILITYNVGGATGYFSVFDTTSPTEPVYTYTMSNGTEPFGAIGYYWGPGEGYFPGGETNTNDVFIWALDNNLQNETVGVGQVFAFQLPEFNVTLVGGERLWQSPLPPIITNGGISMYWAVSKSEQRCWNGEAGRARFDFTQGGETVTFDRGLPRSAAALAPPTLSSAAIEPFVVGPTASNQLFRLPFDYSGTPVTTATNGVVSSRVLISKDDLYVYYATPNPDNTLYQLDAATFDVIWNITFPNGISGDIAQSLNGDTIFVADIVGSVYAYKVANAPVANITQAPTNPPVATPAPAPTSVNGTMSPAPSTMTNGTMMPGTMDPNPNGTMAPMSLVSNETKAPNTPVSKPAAAPAKAPVAAPVKAPVAGPVAGPAATPAATPAAGPVAVPSKPVSPPVKAPAAAPTSSAGAAAVGAILSSALLIAVLAVGMV